MSSREHSLVGLTIASVEEFQNDEENTTEVVVNTTCGRRFSIEVEDGMDEGFIPHLTIGEEE